MKTNQIMLRPLGEFRVAQRTQDGMFNATDLLKQWNKVNCENQKRIDHYFENAATQEFIRAVMAEENLHTRNSAYVKSRASRGDNAGTWMHPLLFIDFAMWLNPTFKVKVLKFVSDQLLQYRNEAGDAYRDLSRAVGKIVKPNMMRESMQKVGEALNWVVFGGHETMMRNKQGEEAKMRELYETERKVAALIEEGFILNFASLMNYLRQQWKKKNVPQVFATTSKN